MAEIIDGKVILGPDDGAVIDALRAAMASNAARRSTEAVKSASEHDKSAQPVKKRSKKKRPSL